jgi:hypothetical protein
MTISSNPLSSALAVAAVKFLSSVRYALGTMSYALNLAGRLGSCCSRSGEISIFSNDMAQIISVLAAAHPRYMAAELKMSRHGLQQPATPKSCTTKRDFNVS